MPWLKLLWQATITTLDPSARSSLVAACTPAPHSVATWQPSSAHWGLAEEMWIGQPIPIASKWWHASDSTPRKHQSSLRSLEGWAAPSAHLQCEDGASPQDLSAIKLWLLGDAAGCSLAGWSLLLLSLAGLFMLSCF